MAGTTAHGKLLRSSRHRIPHGEEGVKSRFIGGEVEVHFERKPGPPSAFVWQGQEYRIAEVLETERELDFKRSWWQRRHRDRYVVRTDSGRIFELHFHRGPGRKYWVLYLERLEEGKDS